MTMSWRTGFILGMLHLSYNHNENFIKFRQYFIMEYMDEFYNHQIKNNFKGFDALTDRFNELRDWANLRLSTIQEDYYSD